MSRNNNQEVFARLEKLTYEEGQNEFGALLLKDLSLNQKDKVADGNERRTFLKKLIQEIDNLSKEIKDDATTLVSVKHQKLLRTSFQIISSLGVSPCLIPGVGISLLKRCSTAVFLPQISMTDEDKYELLVECTDFFTRCYTVPVIRIILITYHLSDYLASLIQLAFAPLKKPGNYGEFTMTEDMYDKLNHDRKSYTKTYHSLVANCFQPIIMKELLVLQGVTNPSPPAFVKRVIAKEMSRRLLNPGGLLSLIRCFIETYEIDTGYEWRKIDMIAKIVSSKHGTSTESDYLQNMCFQIAEVLLLKNTHYLSTAVACIISLKEKFPDSEAVTQLFKGIFQAFDYEHLTSKVLLPGTIVLSPQEVQHGVTILHASVCSMNWNLPAEMSSNLFLLFHLGMNCTKNRELKTKIKDIILKSLSACNKTPVVDIIKLFLFGLDGGTKLNVEEFDAGVTVQCVEANAEYNINDALLHFLDLFRSAENNFIEAVFGASLQILVDLTKQRQNRGNNDLLLLENNPEILDKTDQQYAVILQLLTEISTSPKVMNLLKTNPLSVLDFIEHFLLKTDGKSNEECVTIALVLLNMLMSNSIQTNSPSQRFYVLLPVLRKMAEDASTFNNILCKEAITLISSEHPTKAVTACEKAIADVFDNLLPVRAHGVIALTKLIDAKDPETLSKKHYLFCIFQEQLKDPDSYIYLSSINGIAALGTHCTEDVLHVLCQEFLKVPSEGQAQTEDSLNKLAELRMKVGDIIVKVTKRLGEMAIIHKTILLNTMLGACRDDDPLIRTSALSNLAEIALVLHYKVGSIIYEILLCIWGIIETDKAVEARRAAVMVISSLLKGLGSETLKQLKENILPLYRTLKRLYNDPCEDSVVKLHSQIALEELNDIVNKFLFPELKMERQIYVLDSLGDLK